jgi:hypothetical protein
MDDHRFLSCEELDPEFEERYRRVDATKDEGPRGMTAGMRPLREIETPKENLSRRWRIRPAGIIPRALQYLRTLKRGDDR